MDLLRNTLFIRFIYIINSDIVVKVEFMTST